MVGAGFLRDFNDSIKQNRDLLKAGKKDFLDRDSKYRLRTGEIVFRDRECSPDTLKLIQARAKREAKAQQKRQILILLLSFIMTIILFAYLLQNS
jgi:hypothetical protein